MKDSILFNLLSYKPTATGLSRYVERLLEGWTAATGQPVPKQLRLTEIGKASISRQSQMPKIQSSKLMRWCQQRAVVQHFVPTNRLIEEIKPSLIYSPYTDLLNSTKNYRQVITCHDLTPLYFPNSRKAYLHYRFWQPINLHRANHVIAISKSVANQLIKHGVSASKITIVPNGIEEILNPTVNARTENCLILARHARNKNITVALKGFANFLKLHRSWQGKLIIVGSKDRCTQDLYRLALELGLSDKVCWPNHLSEHELNLLIRQSLCLISSSLMEGFDYPLLEAQARGIPTLASLIPVHHEIYENTSLFFNPRDNGESLGTQLQRLVSEHGLWQQLSKAGISNAKKYSLKKQIQDIDNLLAELATMPTL
jgi:glycosyltransferase involved in cell wall biosynthesis